MIKTTNMLYLTIIAAGSALVCAVAASRSARKGKTEKLPAVKLNWKENTADSFTGWLARLKQDIHEEVGQ